MYLNWLLRRGGPAICFGLLAVVLAPSAGAITPDDPGPGDVLFSINSAQNVKSISPYIYGSNSSVITNRTLDRSGGNRMTGYNWETNASNAGSDYYHHSDYYLTGGQAGLPPGAAIEPMITAAGAAGRASIVTVPMAGYVSADANGTVDETEIAPSARWREVVAKKSTIYGGGATLSLTPDENDGYVFTDEFVNWVENTKQAGQPVFYSLDNEPALWGETLPPGWQSGIEGVLNPSSGGRTHPTIHPYEPTYTEMRDKTIAHASAIKDVNPDALVFGGVGYGWNEFRSLQDAPGWLTSPSHPGGDQAGELHYYEWLLNEVAQEEAIQGRKLMDVIDLHWYPEAQGQDHNGNYQRITFGGNQTDDGVVAARVQAVRSLWDETYTETSWITGCCSGGPIKLLKHLERDIDDFNPGTKMAITEYNYGANNHYSGGIAQADFLGTMGKEGVFAASFWPLGGSTNFVNAAFDMYLDYDGAGGSFGDISVDAGTDDIDATAVYASLDSEDPNRMILVAINRTGTAQDVAIAVDFDRAFSYAEVYELTSVFGSPVISQEDNIELTLLNAFHYTLPAWGVATLVLVAEDLPGDYNGDGIVNAADYTVWRNNKGTSNVLPGDTTPGTVDQSDYIVWRDNYGATFGSGSAGASPSQDVVPEPAAAVLLMMAAMTLAAYRKRTSH